MEVGAIISTVTEHFAAVSINRQTRKHGSHDELTMFTVCANFMSVRGAIFFCRGAAVLELSTCEHGRRSQHFLVISNLRYSTLHKSANTSVTHVTSLLAT